MDIKISKELQALPPYLFVEIDKARRLTRQQGRDIIDFGVGDPDQPTPKHIIEALRQAAQDPVNHRYALDQGMPILREAIANWYKNRFNVDLNANTEVLPLIGSKEGIAHLPLAFVNVGDYTLVPDPSYPPYKGGTILAGGRPYILPLLEKNNFLPCLTKIPKSILKKAKIIYLNYPNNPTGAIATKGFFEEAVKFALKNRIIIASDLAYSEIAFDDYKAPSILEIEGAKEVAIEFHSLSKTFNMTGWRIGWASGNEKIIAALGKVKSNIDSGIFQAIQIAGVAALKSPQAVIADINKIYQDRRDILIEGLNSLGFFAQKPKATFYVWMAVPKKYDSRNFAKLILEKCDIVATPGIGFGKFGQGYIRMALTVSKERIKEALTRLKKIV